jgi:hypothetical protein
MKKLFISGLSVLTIGILTTGLGHAQVLGAQDINPAAITGGRRPQCVLNTGGAATIAAYGTSAQSVCANWAQDPATQTQIRFDQDPTLLAVSMPMCWTGNNAGKDALFVVFDSDDGSWGSQICRSLGLDPASVHGKPQPGY